MGNSNRKHISRKLTGPEPHALECVPHTMATLSPDIKQASLRKKTVTIRDPLTQNWSLRGSMHRRSILRRPSDFADIEHFTKAAKGVQLSEREILLVRDAFPSDSGALHEFAILIFKRLFKRHPVVRDLFPHANTPYTDDLDNEQVSDWLKEHARKFANVLDMVIASGLDALDDSVGPYLLAQGAKHAHFISEECSDNLQQDCWDWLAQSMCDTAAASWHIRQCRLETLCAWRCIVFFLVRKLRQGCDFERGLNLCHKTSVTDGPPVLTKTNNVIVTDV